MKILLLLLLMSLTSMQAVAATNGALDQNLDGFKEIKFDLNLSQLQDLGLDCSASKCTNTNRPESLNSLTFLGNPIYYAKNWLDGGVTVWISDSEVIDQITLYVEMTGAAVSNSLQHTLGEYVRSNDWDYWFFKNGAAIATYNPDTRFFPAKTVYYAPEYAKRILTAIAPLWLLEGNRTIDANDY